MKIVKAFSLTLAAALAVGGLSTLATNAAETPAPNGPLHGQLRERIKGKLGLTDDQIAQIKTQLKSEKDNISSLMTRLHDAHGALRVEIQKSDATETSVREAAAKLAAVESDLAVERLKLHGKISPILTDEQRAKLGQFEAGVDRLVNHAINRVHERLSE